MSAPRPDAPRIPSNIPGQTEQSWSAHLPARSGILTVILVSLGIAFGALALIVVIGYLALGLGAAGVAIAAVLALIPLAIVLFAIRWIDRWEPEPRAALWFAFLWGAGVAVAAALIFDLGVQLASAASGVALQNQFAQSVLQAPIVEEVGKGLGILLVLWAGRRYFDGPVDGLVYAATVAAGFAFTENILYFGSTLIEGGAGAVVPVFIARGIFSPFAHIIFTSCTGLALGVASRRTGGFGAVGWFLLGLVPAVALHALWNGALLVVTDVIGYYAVVQVPIFASWVALVLVLRVQERRITRQRLTEYAAVGWFTPSEVELVSSFSGRRAGRMWARGHADASRKSAAMAALIRDATRLAQTRHRVASGRDSIGRSPDERTLLDKVAADRRALLS